MTRSGEAGDTASLPLGVVHPAWLVAVGGNERVEVFRSPVVRESDSRHLPVRRFIKDHGLVLAARESFSDADWMFGEVEVSVYVPPAMRNGVLACTEWSLPWHTTAAKSSP